MSNMTDQYQRFLAPVIKANKLSASNLETLVHFQTSALQVYVDIAIGRLKAASEVSDPSSLQSFLTGQAEVIAGLQQKFAEDAKTLGELAGKFKVDFEKLVQDSMVANK